MSVRRVRRPPRTPRQRRAGGGGKSKRQASNHREEYPSARDFSWQIHSKSKKGLQSDSGLEILKEDDIYIIDYKVGTKNQFYMEFLGPL